MAIGPQHTKHAKPARVLIHAGPKTGKSTFFASAPGTVFLPCEDGLNGIQAIAIVEHGKTRYDTLEEFYAGLSWCEQNITQFSNVCIDSLDWLENLIIEHVCRSYNVKQIGAAAGGFGKGYEEVFLIWRQIIARLDWLNSQGKGIFLIAHSKAVEFADPMHDTYDVWEIKLYANKKGQGALTLFKEWVDIIGFAEVERATITKTDSDRVRASETGRRLLHVNGCSGFLAGNRYSLPSPLPLDWNAFSHAMASTVQPAQ